MSDRTSGGLFLPDAETLAMEAPPPPAFAKPQEPQGEGIRIDAGFVSPYFVTDVDRWWVELDRPEVVVFERTVELNDLVPIAEAAAATAKPFLVAAPAVSAEARTLLVINKLRGILHVSAIETPRAAELKGLTPTKVICGLSTTLISAA
jgi:hypothetical protein